MEKDNEQMVMGDNGRFSEPFAGRGVILGDFGSEFVAATVGPLEVQIRTMAAHPLAGLKKDLTTGRHSVYLDRVVGEARQDEHMAFPRGTKPDAPTTEWLHRGRAFSFVRRPHRIRDGFIPRLEEKEHKTEQRNHSCRQAGRKFGPNESGQSDSERLPAIIDHARGLIRGDEPSGADVNRSRKPSRLKPSLG